MAIGLHGVPRVGDADLEGRCGGRAKVYASTHLFTWDQLRPVGPARYLAPVFRR